MNRTIVESARSMLFHSNTPTELWAEVVNTVVYLRNRSPTTALDGITPYECLFNRKPDVANLRVFGCVAFVHIPVNQRRSLKQSLERQFLLDILKAPRNTNCMIQILAVSSGAVTLYSLKQNFITLAVNSPLNHVLITRQRTMFKLK